MTVVNHATGEVVETAALAIADTSSGVAITGYLQQARDWLATAVEETGPEQIAMAKAEIATAAEATKQLGLSKEIQEDAAEMVRRAEWTLRKAITKAQQAGEVASRDANLRNNRSSRNDGTSTSADPLPAPRDFFSSESEYRDSNAMAALDRDQFEEVLDAAKAEGNASRANVAAKAREKTGKPKARPRKPLPDQFRDRLYDLLVKAESVHRLTEDDRWASNAKKLATVKNRNELLRINDLLQQVINSLPENEVTS